MKGDGESSFPEQTNLTFSLYCLFKGCSRKKNKEFRERQKEITSTFYLQFEDYPQIVCLCIQKMWYGCESDASVLYSSITFLCSFKENLTKSKNKLRMRHFKLPLRVGLHLNPEP
ncbi:hypothetical protein FQA47_006759 [Oryzias melastigma]|uniref:Uncharacterized protein n=1 Tax=Oryzias melastigma TaxID=30732 RepID=A0A834CQY2_ORYME|nr:hypothetical protein FQA47_006759 [Oryzias melastigma]